VRAGPKAEITAPPLDLSGLPPIAGDRVIAFCEEYLFVPKGTGARRRLRLRDWQRDIVRGLFDVPRPRQGLVSIPRGNGKSTLAAALGLYGLFGDDVEGAQVLCVASDERQARIVFNAARRMVELEARLDERCQIFQNRIYVPHTDSSLYPLPAETAALQGYDPSLAIVDELHVVTRDVWEAVSLAAGKRDQSLTLAISTPAADTDSVMWSLVEHGRTGSDPAFFFREFAAPPGCAVDDQDAWTAANPALDDFLHRDRAAGHAANVPGVVVPAVPARAVGRPGRGGVASRWCVGSVRRARARDPGRGGRGPRPGRVVLPGLHRPGRRVRRRRAARSRGRVVGVHRGGLPGARGRRRGGGPPRVPPLAGAGDRV
jgi:hypothetical protein